MGLRWLFHRLLLSQAFAGRHFKNLEFFCAWLQKEEVDSNYSATWPAPMPLIDGFAWRLAYDNLVNFRAVLQTPIHHD